MSSLQDYFESSWLTEPPEDNSEPLEMCAECGLWMYEGDTGFYSNYDPTDIYCSEQCFLFGEMEKTVLKC